MIRRATEKLGFLVVIPAIVILGSFLPLFINCLHW
ncbi:hypothetical protein P378_03125 [Desulforamulus profundi]|uniref:Uncharacterized protein n=1 Tax=Desulforamulus profundi TaxID=1383067 RepID=A0A2C6MIQ0_9FIRM|nr:hypothetical protein P378_03125 [Desulforamulus profundi]